MREALPPAPHEALGTGRHRARAQATANRACDAGDGDACADLGAGFDAGDFDDPGATRATTAFRRGCELGSALACEHLGVRLLAGPGVEQDVARGLATLQRACDGGATHACHLLASRRCEERTSACSEARAVLERGCAEGSGGACFWLSTIVTRQASGPADRTRADELARRACRLGVLLACEAVASGDLETARTEDERAAAVSVLARLCAVGRPGRTRACGDLGARYAEGRGVALDLGRAAGLWTRGCQLLDGYSCARLAVSFVEGGHTRSDPTRGAQIADRACDESTLDRPVVCRMAGAYATAGHAGRVDMGRAVACFTLACDGGDAVGCQNLAEHILAGEGTAPDGARALTAMRRACELGPAKACVLADVAHATQVSLVGPRATVAADSERGCAAGDGAACVRLAFVHAMGHGVMVDVRRSAAALRRACAAGLATTCAPADALEGLPTEGHASSPTSVGR